MKRPEPQGKQAPARGTPDVTPTTQRQQTILSYISSYIVQNGYPPTMREIGRCFRIASPNGVACHLRALRSKGLLTWEEGKSRSLNLPGRSVLLVDNAIRDDVMKYANQLLQRRRGGDSG